MTHALCRALMGFMLAVLLLGPPDALSARTPAQGGGPTPLPPVAFPDPRPASAPEFARFHDNTRVVVRAPFATLADFGAATNAVIAGDDRDAFWQAVLSMQQMPLIFGNTAVFLYRGEATTVDWRGDFTRWNSLPALRGRRLGASDIWVATKTFPLDARLDYKIVLNGNRQILDPLNAYKQLGGYGLNSVVRMPDYVYPAITVMRKTVAHGALSEPQLLGSRHLQYTVRYWVYTPPHYETLSGLPVLYVTDGQEYMAPEMGALPIVIDNLIADGAIEPIIAVFVDPRDPQTGMNRRGPELLTNDKFEAFMIRELVPAIETAYEVSRKREDRALLGASLGGLRATWAILRNPEMWGLAALQSPYYKAKQRVLAQFAASEPLPVKVFVCQGTYDLDVEGTRHLRDVLAAKGWTYKYVETDDGHSYGNWRGVLDDMLIFFWGR